MLCLQVCFAWVFPGISSYFFRLCVLLFYLLEYRQVFVG